MGDVNSLMNNLFSTVERANERLEKYQGLPNFTGGYDIRSRSGEVIASYQPGVGISDGVISDASGDVIARTRDNVMGGTTYDFGQGHTMTSRPNVHGGETFSDNLTGAVGYTEPAFGGGIKLHTPSGETLLAQSDPISGGIAVTSTPALTLPDFDSFISVSTSSLDQLDALSGALVIGTSLDAAGGFELFELLGELI